MTQPRKGFFGKLVESFKDSLIDEKLEADLYDVQHNKKSSDEKGEIEFFRHTQGHTSLHIKLDTRDLEDGCQAALHINGEFLLNLDVTKDKPLRIRLSSKQGDNVPAIEPKDIAEIQFYGETFFRGVFEKD